MVRRDDRVDWYRVILEIQRGGVTIREISRRLERSHSAVLQWQEGNSSPRHYDGEALVVLWCQVTANGRESVPFMRQTRPRPIPVKAEP